MECSVTVHLNDKVVVRINGKDVPVAVDRKTTEVSKGRFQRGLAIARERRIRAGNRGDYALGVGERGAE
jgi:hypothetical protein